MENQEKKLQVRHLQISFRTAEGKVQAVRDISFDLYKGETLAIVGESGSGKSVTSKAILGIQAANAITEGGEILYDGQDLLRINEEDFYRLRGDKIAMIFQDPLSSLNPIMRIGKQLTEAMLLKGKARQRSSKESFKTMLSELEKAMKEAAPEKSDRIGTMCEAFRRFEHKHTEMELSYNTAMDGANDAIDEGERVSFLIEKDADVSPASVKRIAEGAVVACGSPYVVPADRQDEVKALAKTLAHQKKNKKDAGETLKQLLPILQDAVSGSDPDFFAIGYCVSEEKMSEMPSGSIDAQNAACAAKLEQDFMNEFRSLVAEGIALRDKQCRDKRQRCIVSLKNGIDELQKGTVEGFHATADALCKEVEGSINPLDPVKDSAAYTFSGSMKGFLDRYNEGKRTNAAKERKYARQKAKAERNAARGKSWTAPAASVIDLDLVKENILTLQRSLSEHYQDRNDNENADPFRKAERMLDYLKENASGMVNVITKSAARRKALKLMEEVGIDQPARRYRQYPFEFSGGMRQRIVIAIALAANPDILICDEPTTALDVTIQAQILELINDLKRKRNLTIIFITHDLGVVANMADRIAVMYAGKIVEYGKAEEIFYEPAHPYTWALLSSMPDLDTKEKLEAIPGTPPNMIYPPKGDAFAERNRYAMKIDFEQQPPQFPITDTHWAATWLLHPKAPKVDPPRMVTDRIAKMKARVEADKNV